MRIKAYDDKGQIDKGQIEFKLKMFLYYNQFQHNSLFQWWYSHLCYKCLQDCHLPILNHVIRNYCTLYSVYTVVCGGIVQAYQLNIVLECVYKVRTHRFYKEWWSRVGYSFGCSFFLHIDRYPIFLFYHALFKI